MSDPGRFSVAFPRQQWYPATPSARLRNKPVGTELMDEPVVLFRDSDGRAHAIADRCPHRGLPLSLGRVASDGCIECCYHGWRFDGGGTCVAVPGLIDQEPAGVTRGLTSYPTREQDGFVWVWPDLNSPPAGSPFPFPQLSGSGSGEVIFDYDLECTMHAALENALDVPHTAFLHRGIFRGGDPRKIEAVRRDVPGGVEVQYFGEPVGVGRLRGSQDSSLTFEHWDRFFLPSIAQVEYRVEGWLRIVNTIVHLPMSPFRTRAWFVVRWWSRLPAAAVRPIVLARGKQILRQDAWVLKRQADHARRAGGERYTSTDLDVIGNAIWRLLRQAERTEAGEVTAGDGRSADETRITFTV